MLKSSLNCPVVCKKHNTKRGTALQFCSFTICCSVLISRVDTFRKLRACCFIYLGSPICSSLQYILGYSVVCSLNALCLSLHCPIAPFNIKYALLLTQNKYPSSVCTFLLVPLHFCVSMYM